MYGCLPKSNDLIDHDDPRCMRVGESVSLVRIEEFDVRAETCSHGLVELGIVLISIRIVIQM